MVAREAEASRSQALNADCQSFASLCTTGIDHIASAMGFHSGPKSMSAGSFDFAGLIRSLHYCSALKFGSEMRHKKTHNVR